MANTAHRQGSTTAEPSPWKSDFNLALMLPELMLPVTETSSQRKLLLLLAGATQRGPSFFQGPLAIDNSSCGPHKMIDIKMNLLCRY